MGQKTELLFAPRTPRSASPFGCAFLRPSSVLRSSGSLNFSKIFAFPGLSRLLLCCHFAQLQRCKVFSRLCFTLFRRLVVFIAIHAALFRCSLLMLCLFALLPLSLLSLLRLRCPECQDPVVPEALRLCTWRLFLRGSRVVRSLAQ